MTYSKINTLGELKKSGYVSKSIKQEIRENLIKKILEKEKQVGKDKRSFITGFIDFLKEIHSGDVVGTPLGGKRH